MVQRNFIRMARKRLSPQALEEELGPAITHEEMQKANELKRLLMNYEKYIGATPTQEQVINYIKRCAVADLTKQLGRPPTREEAITHLRIIKLFVTDGNLKNFLEEYSWPKDSPF